MKHLSNVELAALLKLSSYTSATSHAGTAAGLLAFDSTGNVITTAVPGLSSFTSQVKHEVKLGEDMVAGTPVYVPITQGAGTVMTVMKASNSSESTSSKTMGIIETGGSAGATVYVITEGLLAGLDTSTASKGDPVWLGTNGVLIFGLANKPSAPAHLVFLGIVTRAQQNNGEIFVKVQNGFELEELHNVAITSVANNDGLFYDSATSLWKNKTIAAVLGYTPYNASNPSGYISSITSGMVTTALGYTPYNASNPSGYISGITSGMVTTALGYTPYNSTNPSGYITGITSGNVTTALGYTPYNSTNPSGYITSSALSSYLPLSGGTLTGALTTTVDTSGAAIVAQNNGNAARWYGRVGSFNSTADKAAFVGTYGSVAVVGAHNNALTAWANLYVNNVDGANGGNVYLPTNSYVASNAILHAGNYSSYALPLSGGVMTGSLVNNTDGAVMMESNASENNNWIWKENAKNWGLFWFNRGTQSGQIIGDYTTIGAELMFMGAGSGIDMPTGWTGYSGGSKIAAMISNYNGYIYSASTIYAATSMVVGGNTVLHAGNASYAWNMNQAVRTDSTPTFADVYTGGWFRNNTNNAGLYSTANNVHFYSSSDGRWNIGSGGRTNGALVLRVDHQSTIKGYVYWDTSGFGLLNDQGGWSVLAYQGASYGGELRGIWTMGGNTIITSANIGSQSVSSATTANYFNSNGITNNGTTTEGRSATFRTESGTGGTRSYAPILHIAAGDTMWQLQGMYYYQGNDIQYRAGYNNGNWQSWQTLLHSGNVSSYALPITGGTVTGVTDFGTTAGDSDQGIGIRYGNDVGGYGRIRFYQSGTNVSTIHSFSSTWQNGTLSGASSGAINISGVNGVTVGQWNNADLIVVTGGQTYARGYRGIGNVAGTGEATFHPAGIYSTGTQWLYGHVYRNQANTYAQGYIYQDGNYGYGLVGLYSAARLQAIFAMGDAYKIAVDGTNSGNLYGLAWSHPNAGGQAGYLTNHGLIHMMYGTAFATISDTIWCRGDITAYSDARVKDNIKLIDNALEKVKSIRGVTYTRTDIKDTEKRHAGVIAQEVLAVLPEVISTNKDNGHYSVSYGNMAGLFIEAIKEQQQQIESQNIEINELKDLVKQLLSK